MTAQLSTRAGVFVASAAVAMSVAACGGSASSSSSSSSSSSGSSSSSATQDLKVGIITINAGSFAALSKESIDAATITADELNSQQHKHKVSIVQIDTDGTPNNTLQAVSSAVQQKDVKYVSGFFTSSTGLALQAQAKRLGVLMLAAVNQSSTLVGAGCNSNYFQISTVDSQYTLGATDVLKKSGVTTWDAIAEDYSAGHDKVTQFDAAVAKAGGKIQTSVFPTLGATDFGTQISKLSSNPAGGLFVGILGADAATFAKQAAQFGLFSKYKFIIGSGYLQAPLLPALGDAAVGTHEVLNYSPEVVAATPFGTAYAAKSDGPLWHVPIEGRLALVLLADAADKAASTDPNKVGQSLSGLSADTIVGKVTMRPEDHLLLQDLYPAVAEAGPKLVVNSTVPVADATPPVDPACKMS